MCWWWVTTLCISLMFMNSISNPQVQWLCLASRLDCSLVVAAFPTPNAILFFLSLQFPCRSLTSPCLVSFLDCRSLWGLPGRGNHWLQAAFFYLDFCLLKPCLQLKAFIISFALSFPDKGYLGEGSIQRPPHLAAWGYFPVFRLQGDRQNHIFLPASD